MLGDDILKTVEIKKALDDATILACFTLVKALRPHLSKADFIEQVGRQRKKGY